MSEMDEFKNDIERVFSEIDTHRGIAAIANKWKSVGYSETEIVELLRDAKMIYHLSGMQRVELAKALDWLRSDHEHIDTRWDV